MLSSIKYMTRSTGVKIHHRRKSTEITKSKLEKYTSKTCYSLPNNTMQCPVCLRQPELLAKEKMQLKTILYLESYGLDRITELFISKLCNSLRWKNSLK